jgi:hypothetical protein
MGKIILKSKDGQKVTLEVPDGPVILIKDADNIRPVQLSGELWQVTLDDIQIQVREDSTNEDDTEELEAKVEELEGKIAEAETQIESSNNTEEVTVS